MAFDLGSELLSLLSEIWQGWESLPPFNISSGFGSRDSIATSLTYGAPALQIAGYITYFLYILSGRITPNPWSWLMFAYGTSLLTFLEWKLGAPLAILYLPIACSALSIILFGVTLFLPETEFSYWDLLAFVADLGITGLYWWSAHQLMQGSITPTEHSYNTVLFLVGTNLTTLTAFSPLIREGFARAGHEAPLPWMIWTMAYGSLAVLTAMQSGTTSILMIYPLLNVVLHSLIGYLSLRDGGNQGIRS